MVTAFLTQLTCIWEAGSKKQCGLTFSLGTVGCVRSSEMSTEKLCVPATVSHSSSHFLVTVRPGSCKT